jgi:hypothetical protein
MGTKNSPSIVRNGLVLNIDAANTRSYNESCNTWYDLSGSTNNFILDSSDKIFYRYQIVPAPCLSGRANRTVR